MNDVTKDEAGLFSTVLSLLLGIVLVGFALALYRSFDGDVVAILTRAWDGVTGLIKTLADWFSSNSTFRELVG